MTTTSESVDSKRKFNVEVPPSLRPLLETIAKEVIRNHPTDVFKFTSLLVKKIVQIRSENHGIGPTEDKSLYPAFKQALTAEAIQLGLCSNNSALENIDLSDKLNKTSSTPQIVEPENVKSCSLDESAAKIQAGIRGFLTRKHLEEKGIKVHHPVHHPQRCRSSSPTNPDKNLNLAKSVINKSHSHEALVKTVVNDVDDAASKIQAGIRGFLTRKHLEEKGVKVHHPEKRNSQSPIPPVDGIKVTRSQDNLLDFGRNADGIMRRKSTDSDEAASKIQAGIRGFLTRKHLHDKGIPVQTPHELHMKRMSVHSNDGV